MPMTVKVGLAKKVGQPDFGSLGASCDIELELDGSLLFHDLDGLQQKVQAAYTACRQAVNDELASQMSSLPSAGNATPVTRSPDATNPQENASSLAKSRPSHSQRRAATSAQLRALHSIATRQNFNLTDLLRDRFHIYKAEELSLREASQLIDELNTTPGSRA